MADSLQLDSIQFVQLLEVHLQLTEEMDRLSLRSGKKLSKQEQRTLQALMIQTESKYKELLTEQQYSRFKAMRMRGKPKRKPDSIPGF